MSAIIAFMRTHLRPSLLAIPMLALTIWLALGAVDYTGMAHAQDCDDSLPGSTPCAGWFFGTTMGEISERRSLVMLDYSLGVANDNDCFSCKFVQQFIIALASFSAGVFMYFRAFFVTLMPLAMALWIGWSASRVMIAGGDGGGAFFSSMVKKMALFTVLWLVMMTSGPTGPTARDPSQPMPISSAYEPWTWFGPGLLGYGLELSNEIRTTAAANLSVGGSTVNEQLGMNCRGIGAKSPVLAADPTSYEFAFHASELACAIERVHIIGMASGLSMMEGAWVSMGVDWGGGVGGIVMSAIASLFNALMTTVFGLVVLATFGLSLVWFTFLILDVVVKILIIAAVSPILMLLALLVPTRRYGTTAIFHCVASVGTLVGIAFIAALAFFLIANVVDVYLAAKVFYDPSLPDIPRTNVIADLRNFIIGLQIESGRPGHIPMNMATPWYHYMLLTSLSITVLGKKIIAIIESIVGVQNMSQMADNARQVAVMGSVMAMTTGYMGFKAGSWGLGKAIQGGNMAVGGGKAALGYAKAYREGGWAQMRAANPFGNNTPADAVKTTAAAAAGPGGFKQAMDFQNKMTDAINKNTTDAEPPK